MSTEEKITTIVELLAQLSEDTTLPRNIRRGATLAKESLLKADEAVDLRKAKAISILDELANDSNIPIHGRTTIWDIIGRLEAIK
jgi:uncharacterized protein (UPF0147 family)